MRKLNAMLTPLIALIGLLILALSAHAASFDCAKASTKIEKMICDNDKVSRADEMVDLDYLRALERTDTKQQLIQDQRNWLKNVRNACPDADCLFKAYAVREGELDAIPTHKCYWLEPPLKDASGKRPPIEPICRVMEENLNQFCNRPPMVCGLKIAPQFSQQITLPTWVPLDPKANHALIDDFLRAPYEGSRKQNADAVWSQERPKLEAAFANKRIAFSKAQLDLYNLGKLQTAYRLDYGNCQADNSQLSDPSQWKMAVHYPEIKTQFTPDIIRHLFQENFSVDRYLTDVFLYKGKVYDYFMAGTENPATGFGENRLIINRHEQESYKKVSRPLLLMKKICIFNYRPIQDESK